MKSWMKQVLAALMWSPACVVVRVLPVPLVWAMARVGGMLLWHISPCRRATMMAELQRLFSDRSREDIRRLAQEAYVNFCEAEMEILLFPRMNAEYVRQRIVLEGREILDEALARGRGVLLFQAHFGAFQMTMPALGYSGYRMSQISVTAEAWKNDTMGLAQHAAFDRKAAYERALPVRRIDIRGTMRPVYRALQAGEIVGIAVDGAAGNRPVTVSFLGHQARFQTGAAQLALRTGAIIVPAVIFTDPYFRHRLVLHPPIEGRTQEELVSAFVSHLEAWVKDRPSHYAFTLMLRRLLAHAEASPFFTDYDGAVESDLTPPPIEKGSMHATS